MASLLQRWPHWAISIHAPREGSDQGVHDFFCRARQISIHAPREGSDPRLPCGCWSCNTISIHAPREGSDVQQDGQDLDAVAISIHAPREGSDRQCGRPEPLWSSFLSTLPARGATGRYGGVYQADRHFYPRSPRGERHLDELPKLCNIIDFYPRSPRGERRSRTGRSFASRWISIHAPREGSDSIKFYKIVFLFIFLSTLPARGATSGVSMGAASS